MNGTARASCAAGMPSPKASLRAWKAWKPTRGSIGSFRMASGIVRGDLLDVHAARADAMKTGLPWARSSTMPR